MLAFCADGKTHAGAEPGHCQREGNGTEIFDPGGGAVADTDIHDTEDP